MVREIWSRGDPALAQEVEREPITTSAGKDLGEWRILAVVHLEGGVGTLREREYGLSKLRKMDMDRCVCRVAVLTAQL